jgi:hypothetical protein
MTELDKRKSAVRRNFDNLPAAERKEVIETYGDDLLKWHEERMRKQEMAIRMREEKLRKLGVNIDKLREKMGEYLAARFGSEDEKTS